MLNRPKFMSPSTNLPHCTVDASSSTINFSCVVDGNEAINRYILNIHNLSTNTIVATQDSDEVTVDGIFDSDGLFYPINEKNENNVLTIPFDNSAGLITNRKNAYYWTITVVGTSGVVVTSVEEVFYANALPTLYIKYSYNKTDYTNLSQGAVLSNRSVQFKATYEQDQGVGLKRYGWRLKDVSNNRTLIDTITKKQIYGTANNIVCSYDGFLDDSEYSIQLYVETQNGVEFLTYSKTFSFNYDTTFVTSDFKVEALKTEPSVMLDWGDTVAIMGSIYDGDEKYREHFPIVDYSAEEDAVNHSIEIADGSSVVWDYDTSSSLNLPQDSYMVISTQIPELKDTVLFYAEGFDDDGYRIMRKLSFELNEDGASGSFVYRILNGNGTSLVLTHTPIDIYQPSESVWYIITMAPYSEGDNALKVVESRTINGLYPASNLYPSSNAYPHLGTWDKLKTTVATVEEGGES